MEAVLPLDKMTIEEKLHMLEILWDDLCRCGVPSPQWHHDVLLARETHLTDGQERFTGWEEAKQRIRETAR